MASSTADLPNLVQMDASLLAGCWRSGCSATRHGCKRSSSPIRARRPLRRRSNLRARATGRAEIVHCENAFHGLTYGALSAVGDDIYRKGFGPMMPGFARDPIQRPRRARARLRAPRRRGFPASSRSRARALNALGRLSRRRARTLPQIRRPVHRRRDPDRARSHGRFLAVEHWGVEPDMVLLAKGLSGGHVPVGVVLTAASRFSTRCSTAWTGRSCMARPSPRTISRWRRGWRRSK